LPNHPPQNLTIATTGASGSVFLRHLLLAVERDARVRTVNFIASDSGLRVLAEELDIQGRSNLVGQLLSSADSVASEKAPRNSTKTSVRSSANISPKIQEQSNADIGANVASGSYPADAMIVIPCSVGTLARIAKRHRLAPDRACGRRLPEREASAGTLRARNAAQQNPYSQPVPGRRCRGDHFSTHPGLLLPAGQLR